MVFSEESFLKQMLVNEHDYYILFLTEMNSEIMCCFIPFLNYFKSCRHHIKMQFDSWNRTKI